jgi:hypothetical protein
MDEWENWETVSIEAELDKLRDEREKLAPATGATGATGKKSGCGKMLLYFILGLVFFQIVGGLLSAFSK